mgnify:CR=1 FL=1
MQRQPTHGYNGANFYPLRNLTFPMVLRRFFKGQALLTIGLMATVLSGCGQKGKLYLPDQPPPHSQQQEDCRTPACAAALEPEQEPAATENSGQDQPKTEDATTPGKNEDTEPPPEETTE